MILLSYLVARSILLNKMMEMMIMITMITTKIVTMKMVEEAS